MVRDSWEIHSLDKELRVNFEPGVLASGQDRVVETW